MILNLKQTEAIDVLEDDKTNILVFGGGAGSSKSFLGSYWILKNCLKYPGTRWLIGRARLSSLKQTTLLTFLEVCKLQEIQIGIHFNINNQSNTITFFNGSVIFLKDLFLYPSDPEFDSLGGLEITGALIEEAQQITRKALTIVNTRIRYKLDEYNLIPKILLTCNPTKNFVYKEFYKPHKEGLLSEDKVFIQALASDNPNISQHYIDNLLKAPKAERERLLYGNWEVDDDIHTLISINKINDLFTNTHVSNDNLEMYISCDVARMGSDKAVIYVWKGFEVIDMIVFDKSKITELQAYIIQLKNKYKVPNSNIIADEDGVGGGLVDNLDIKGFINNSRALNDENYQNLKTQCYYKLAEAIQRNEIYFNYDINDTEKELLIEELEQVKSADSDDGKLKMINKADVKQNIGRSPDYSDALMMRMYFTLVPSYNVPILYF